MITTNFNPYAARGYNMPSARQKQNNVAFEANISKNMMQDLREGESEAYNDVRDLISANIIRAKDGALSQAEELLAEKPGHRWFTTMVEMLKNQK